MSIYVKYCYNFELKFSKKFLCEICLKLLLESLVCSGFTTTKYFLTRGEKIQYFFYRILRVECLTYFEVEICSKLMTAFDRVRMLSVTAKIIVENLETCLNSSVLGFAPLHIFLVTATKQLSES